MGRSVKNRFCCYQAYFLAEQSTSLDSGFIPLLTEGLSPPNLREFGLYRHLLHAGAHRECEYFGIFSHKFGLKSSLSADDVFAFVDENPGYDVYLFNPYPQNAYYTYNIWSQGEVFHPGIVELADELFAAAGLPWRPSTTPRMGHDVLLYSNFWVGSTMFCEQFLAMMDTLWEALESMPLERKGRFFASTEYIVSDCCYLPFIVERFISTWLVSDPGVTRLAYRYADDVEMARCLHPFERGLVHEMRDRVRKWDASNGWTPERRAWMEANCRLNKIFYDIYFSIHPFSL